MFGWLNDPARRDSRRKRRANCGSLAWNADSSFSATNRSRSGWRARYTIAIPPRPSSLRISYRPTDRVTFGIWRPPSKHDHLPEAARWEPSYLFCGGLKWLKSSATTSGTITPFCLASGCLAQRASTRPAARLPTARWRRSASAAVGCTRSADALGAAEARGAERSSCSPTLSDDLIGAIVSANGCGECVSRPLHRYLAGGCDHRRNGDAGSRGDRDELGRLQQHGGSLRHRLDRHAAGGRGELDAGRRAS